jgi:DNA-binding transcriptional MerR regulator
VTVLQKATINFQGKDVGKYTMAVAVMMTGLAAYRIRKFDEFGLCKPVRTGSQQRLYSDNDIEQLHKIALLEKDGVNLPGIKVILGMQMAASEDKGEKP